MAWIAEQCRRESLAPGGFGAAIHDAADAGELTHEEAPLLVRSLLSAGLDTTVHGLGAAALCLAREPAQFAALRGAPERARAAFEEAIRLESPVQTFLPHHDALGRDWRRRRGRGREGINDAG